MEKPTSLPYLAVAALSGALFGIGLYVAQMTDPMKVLNFLNFTAIPEGGWDPSLALVMASALVVMFVAVRIGRRRQRPLLAAQFHEPEYTRIDTPLVAGAALFGVGWGMSGICPGPAISLIAFGPAHLVVFLLAMFAGSYGGSLIVPSGHNRRLASAAK